MSRSSDNGRLPKAGIRKESALVPVAYNTGIRCYRAAVAIASLRNRKARLMRRGHRKVWGILDEKLRKGEKYVWIHTSSLGEFEQGRPLIEMIKRERPDLKVVLSFFSPSGYEVRKNFPLADAVVYLPFDTPANVRRFLDMVNPVAAVFVKYEFWRNYLLELRRRGVPTYLISAVFRPKQLFFRPGGEWYRNLLFCFKEIYVQNLGSRLLLDGIGVSHVKVAGDTRFDRVTDIMRGSRDLPLLERFCRDSSFVFMAGSSWQADEAVYAEWLQNNPGVKAVIAPHEFDAARVEKLKRLFGSAVAWTEAEKDPSLLEGKRVLVMDCFGLLSSAYRYATVAYIGGGFGAGIHNLNEAAVYGIPVLFGPNNRKFIEAKELMQCGGGFEVSDSAELGDRMNKLLGDKVMLASAGDAARAYIESKLGATEKIFGDIFRT